MKKSLNYPTTTKNSSSSSVKLIFPVSAEFTSRTLTVTLAEIIRSSEEMLPFENQRRQRSEAAFYAPFILKKN